MKKHLQLYLQIGLWLVYSILLTLAINKNYSFFDSIMKSTILVIVQSALFYGNSQILFPKLIKSRKTWIYVLNVIIILVILSIFFLWFERNFIPENLGDAAQLRMNRMRERPFRPSPRQLVNARFLFDLLSILLILVLSSAYAATQMSRKRELIESQKNSESLKSEMTFLKSQINPHFLFNALNNIYSLTLTGSEKSSEMILKLSAMLRYILYECNVSFVVIEKEWDYIINFIDFQKLKSKDEINVKLDFNNELANSLITPMILIPFIENAFKHSNLEDSNQGWVHISLNNKIDEIIFQVDNSIAAENISKDDVGGIGLENVKRRLELIYPEKYNLIINDNVKSYSIILQIQKN